MIWPGIITRLATVKCQSRIMNGPENPRTSLGKNHESRPKTIRGPPSRLSKIPLKTAYRPSRHADEALPTPYPARSKTQ